MNSVADAAADASAEHLAPWQEIATVEKEEASCYMIALRIASLEAEATQNRRQVVKFDRREITLAAKSSWQLAKEAQQKVLEKGHVLVSRGKWLHCTRCKKQRKDDCLDR